VADAAGKKVKGPQFMPWSTPETLLMPVIVYSAAIQDRDGAGLVLDKIRRASLALTDLG
jgi:hypothetical protein